jgi:secondary thiamine-phosphate synthase enzyme
MIKSILVPVERQGLHDITERISGLVESENLSQGLCTLFIQHTSASLLIQENYDPTARDDLEAWLNRLVPERDPLYSHTLEGPDDMPAHIKTAITATSLSIPVVDNSLALGAWQGIFLWEHRKRRGTRKLVVHLCT